jgi:hypothetical protein
MRITFFVLGLAALAWGGYLALDFATSSLHDGVQAAVIFVAGPVVHDALVAPLVGVTGLVLATKLPAPWRVPVVVGAVLTAILALLAVPLIWHPFGVATNPGLHDGHYLLGLGIYLAVVWAGVAAAGLVRTHRRSAR